MHRVHFFGILVLLALFASGVGHLGNPPPNSM